MMSLGLIRGNTVKVRARDRNPEQADNMRQHILSEPTETRNWHTFPQNVIELLRVWWWTWSGRSQRRTRVNCWACRFKRGWIRERKREWELVRAKVEGEIIGTASAYDGTIANSIEIHWIISRSLIFSPEALYHLHLVLIFIEFQPRTSITLINWTLEQLLIQINWHSLLFSTVIC